MSQKSACPISLFRRLKRVLSAGIGMIRADERDSKPDIFATPQGREIAVQLAFWASVRWHSVRGVAESVEFPGLRLQLLQEIAERAGAGELFLSRTGKSLPDVADFWIWAHLSWRCNLGDCPYCWLNRLEGVPSDIRSGATDRPAEEWLAALCRLKGMVLVDFLGGEPLIFPGFVDLCRNLPERILFAITTNLVSDNYRRFVQDVQPGQCCCVTASYHPSARLSLDEFCRRLDVFRSARFVTSVNIVEHPSTHAAIPDAVKTLHDRGFRVIVNPYEEVKDLATAVSRHPPRLCRGGSRHFFINNDGSVYPCLTHFRGPHRGRHLLGNFMDRGFRPPRAPFRCSAFCELRETVDPSGMSYGHLWLPDPGGPERPGTERSD